MNSIKEIIIDKERINKVIHSNLFLAIVTMLLFVSWLFSLEILSCIAIVGTIIISSIYSDDANILGALLFLVMISFPTLPYFNTIPIYLIIELISFFVGGGYLLFKKIKNKTFSFKLGPIGLSMIILPIMCLICETVRHITPFNSNSEFILFGYMGVLFILMITIAYFMLYLGGINNKDNYFSRVFLCVNILLLLEAFSIFISNGFQPINFNLLKWGEKNTFALGLEMCLPFVALLFDKNHKNIHYVLLLIIDYVFIVLAVSRGGTFTSIILLPLLIFIGLYSLKNRGNVCRIIFVMSLCLIPICYFFIPGVKEAADNMFANGLGLSHRDIIWEEALVYYRNNPIFGGGISSMFDINVIINGEGNAVFYAHNTFITLLSTCGVIGIISFIILLIEMINVIYNIKSNEKYVYIFFLLVGLIHGLFDNTFYSILYMLPLIYIFANKDLKGIEYKK